MLQVIARANELLEEHGLLQQGWKFGISSEKEAVGRCHHWRKLIVFSRHFLRSSPEQIEDTLLHEIAHALVGSGHGHDAVWAAKAIELGAVPTPFAQNAISTAKFHYSISCPIHGTLGKLAKLRRQMIGGKCKKCGSTVVIKEVV